MFDVAADYGLFYLVSFNRHCLHWCSLCFVIASEVEDQLFNLFWTILSWSRLFYMLWYMIVELTTLIWLDYVYLIDYSNMAVVL